MGKFSQKAKFLDIYASLPSLSFGKDGKVYSRLGLFLTFLTVVIIGGMAIWVGIRIFGRQTPSFIQYQVPPKGLDTKIPWNTDDFKFAFLTALEPEQEDKLISVTAGYSGQGISAEASLCEFPFAPGFKLMCFAQSESSRGESYLDTNGNWEFNISFGFCNDVGTNNCYTEAETKQYMKENRQRVTFVYDDLLIDPFDYENPITVSQNFYTDALLLDIGRVLTVELNEIEFTSDNGWIFEDLKTETKLKATFTMKIQNGDFLDVLIKYGGTKTVYKRTYPKIQDFLAQVGGFITIIMPIFLLLVSPYANLIAAQQMTNEIYEIKLNGGHQQKPSAKKKKQSSVPTRAKRTEANRHVTLDVQPVEADHKKEESIVIPHEDITPISSFRENFDKLPSSPFKTSSRQTARNDDYDTLITPEKSLIEPAQPSFQKESRKMRKQRKDLNQKEEEEIENQTFAAEEESSESEEEEEDFRLRTSDRLEVSWKDWIKSFFKPTQRIQVLSKAKEHILDTFDLVTLSKKVVEIDKLKACLLSHNERVIFENLPLSVIVLDPTVDLKSEKAIQQYHWKESFKGDETALRKAYSHLKGTQEKLGRRLIRLYESEYLDDGDGDAMVRQIDP